MIGIVGIALTFAMVFGGYILAGGKLGVILHSLPFEMMMIGGAAAGAYALSNDGGTIKHTISGVSRVFKGAKWSQQDFQDILCMMFQLLRMARSNPVELEEHIENPEQSSIFTQYPKILSDADAVELVTDTLRSASLNYDDPYQVEDMLTQRIVGTSIFPCFPPFRADLAA
ncbi:motility-associated protein, partial [Paracoccus sp. (in: a-proteobacteria)]|uniref:motility-associated protein n=1 Tax=Paracoccus sp. TaxID=267 RepID=UPI00289772AB